MDKQHAGKDSVAKSIDFLEKKILEARSLNADRLAPISILAKEGGFSPRTITKALKVYRAHGILNVSQRQGIRLASHAVFEGVGEKISNPDKTITPRKKWQLIEEKLESDIRNGVYPPGEKLPSLKELMAGYSCSRQPLNRALQHLLSNNRIELDKRGFRITTSQISNLHHAEVVVVTPFTDTKKLLTVSPEAYDYWRILEDTCKQKSLRLQKISFQDFITLKKRPLGIIIQVLGFLQQQVRALILASEKWQVPVVLYDAGCIIPLEPLVKRYANMKIFTTSYGYNAGVTLGTYVRNNNLTPVAYLSPYGREHWCKARALGIETAFQSKPQNLMMYRSFEKLQPHMIEEKITRMPEFDTLKSSILQFENSYSPGNQKTDFLNKSITSALIKNYIAKNTIPLIESMIKGVQPKSIITSNDVTAEILFPYLSSLSQRPAIFSFDDSITALQLGISSYRQKCTPIVVAIIDFLLAPEHFKNTPLRIEIDGELIIRS